MKIRLVGINARYIHSCLALFYVRNELEAHLPGVVVELCQYTINDPSYMIVQRLVDPETDYYFFSALIWNSELVSQLVADLLTIDPGSNIVIGGPQAAVLGEKFADSGGVSVFIGNIEAAEPRFFTDLQSKSLEKSYESSLLKSGRGRLGYPYREDDFSGPLRNRSIYYESSRGCPFSCSYCLSSVEKGLYHKDLDQVCQELDDILAHRPKTVRFVDRTFNDVPDRALHIWRFLAARDTAALFHFEMAPDRFNEEMFGFLATVKPGLFQFEIGIQSTNPRTLKAINRPIDPVSAGKTIQRLREMENIHLHVDLILGLPHETDESFRKSFNDVFAMRAHYIQMGLLKILPGTEIASSAPEFGIRYRRTPPYHVYATGWMESETLKRYYWFGECVERCLNNRYFVSFWRYLADSNEDMAAFFLELTELFLARGYLWKATTQETLSGLILETIRTRGDIELLRELLCYDWLHCGHRFLPEHLCYSDTSLEDLRRSLFTALPSSMAGLYDRNDRNRILKKAVFHQFSREALRCVGYKTDGVAAIVCFLADREDSVYKFNKTALIEITD